MAGTPNIFDFENQIDELFETVYPRFEPGEKGHPSKRAFKPLLESALSAFVPGGQKSRLLQENREYVKVDFQDFMDYATSGIPRTAELRDFPNHTAIFYESVKPIEPTPDAVWGSRWKFSIRDVAIARDNIFLSVAMRFAVWLKSEKDDSLISEHFGVTLTFTPEKYNLKTHVAGPLTEWERASWWPPGPPDPEWRVLISGRYTSHLLEHAEENPDLAGSEKVIQQMREEEEQNYQEWGAFYEVARLGLYLPSYVDFMYDLVITDRQLAGTVTKGEHGKSRRGKQINFNRPVYKIVRSVRIIRPEQGAAQAPTFRNWTAPSYSFSVQGHWRNFEDAGRVGHDADGNEVLGRTLVNSYRKYEHAGENFDGATRTRDPGVVVKVKQTLQFARDYIDAHSSQRSSAEGESPSVEWMADERAKLSAGLRYLILKRDGFRCKKCGKSQADDNFVKLEVDHIVPVSRWGRTIEENLETLCRDCNKGKSDDS